MFIILYIREIAFYQIKYKLKEQIRPRAQNTKDLVIIAMFIDYKLFKKEPLQIYLDLDKQRIAKRILRNLKQTGLVIAYITEFKQYASKIVYKDASLRNQFYISLKELIKDNIA